MMEEVLTTLSRDATSGKLKSVRDACNAATDGLLLSRTGTRTLEPYELRERCLLPLKIALESRSSKLAANAISGLQKLISDERFRSKGEEDVDMQLPVQFINAVVSTPSLSDEVQVEVMKMLLIITCSASCEVHGEHLIKIAEICIETYIRAHQSATKTACRATLTQMLSSVCHRLQESLNRTAVSKNGNADSKNDKPTNIFATDSNKLLSLDVVLLLKHFCFRLTAGPSSPVQQTNQAVPLYLEAILVMLGSLSTSLQNNKEFITVIWQLLCPALIQLLGSPLTDLSKKTKPGTGSTEDINRGGRGSGSFPKASPVVGPIPRTIYNIANELLRLIGPLAAMRPVLESLFHRIILYPPAHQRTEALKALKEILASPQRLLDAAGPTIIDKDNPPSPDSPTEQKKTDLDLLRLLMDGIVESAHCTDSTVASCSVACVVALLGSLEDLSQGRGLSDEHIEFLSQIKETDNWEEVYQTKEKYDNAASSREVPKFTVANETFEEKPGFEEERRGRGKQLRWDVESTEHRPSPEGDIGTVTERFLRSGNVWESYGNEYRKGEHHDEEIDNKPMQPLQPKSVHFAPKDEVAMFEAYEKQTVIPNNQRTGIPRRSNLPRKIGSSPSGGARTTVRRSASFESKTRPKTSFVRRRGSVGNEPQIYEPASTNGQQGFNEMRSLTDLDISPYKFSRKGLGLPLKRSNSWTALTSSRGWSNENEPDTGDFNKTMITRLSDGARSRPSTRPGEDALWSDNRVNDNQIRTSEILSGRKTYVESKANKLEAKERAERANQEDRSPVKGPRPILRRTKSASDFDRKLEIKNGKPKGILLKSHSEPETEDPPKQAKKTNTPRSQVKINGVYVPRSGTIKALQGHQASHSSPKNVPAAAKKANEVKKSVEENEKEGARNFARCLLGILPSVLSLNDVTAVDESLQQFASDVCEAVTCMALKRKNVPNFGTLRGRSDLVDEKSGEGATSDPHFPILNADGVYLTVYKTLALGLNLLKNGHYQKQTMEPPLTQKEFVDSILDSGVMVGLSSVWLGELYRLVTTYNILGKAGYKLNDSSTNRALVSLLSESIFNADKETGNDMFLRQQEPSHMTPAKREGTKFGRRVLLTTWDSVLEVLSLPLETTASAMGGSNSIAVMLGGESKQRDHNRERDTICLSLDGLRRAARLSCTLGIQTRCELVLALLANASCGGEGSAAKRARQLMASGPVKLHAAQVLSMDGLLAVGVELGSHAPKCWKHVFRCCSYIAELERQQSNNGGLDPSHHPPRNNGEHFSPLSDSTSSSISGYLNGDVSPNGDSSRASDQSSTNGGILSSADVSRAIFALSAAVDRLFEHAANTLNIDALLSFMQSLIQASQKQLFGSSLDATLRQAPPSAQPNSQQSSNYTPLHLYRLADVMLRSARNPNRPLLHLMRAWALLSPHFVEAACHRERHIANLSITCLHDVLSEFLTNRNELPHFWFHEALFKPFESMLTLELCGEEEQERALLTLADLIALHTTSIKSGWRPVFRAIRSVRNYNRQAFDNYELEQRPSPVFTIVAAFLGNKNPAVFGAAAVECIQSLLKFVRGSPYEEPTDDSRSDIDSIMSSESTNILNDMCLPALEHLSNMSKKLASIHIMPSSLVFHGAHSVTLVNLPSVYSTTTTSNAGSSPVKQPSNTVKNKTPTSSTSATTAASITAIDDTGVLRVWYLLLEGLTSAAAYCPRRYQPQTLEVLFEILRSITSVPGPNFSIYTITHLLLPMLREWVYRGERNKHYWESTAANFKHACGLATELIVEELGQFLSVQGAAECVPGMIKQNLDLLIDCVSQPVEGIARLGCSCLRHLLLSGGPLFTEDLWQIVCDGLQEAVQATLFNIKDMVTCFQPGSVSVNGDEGMTVKVVARREAVHGDSFRLQQVAEQVFLLDSQVSGLPVRKEPSRDETSEEDEHRTYMFVLSTIENKDKPENANRVPMRSLLVGLLSHQLLLQTISSVLLSANEDANTTSIIVTSLKHDVDSSSSDGPETILPGLLSYLSPANLSVLFDCLMESHTVAYEFNARPGLRSLIQKLAKLEHPANLLRQSTTAFTCYLHTLFQICKHSGEHFSSSHIKRILTGDRANGNHSNGGHGHAHPHSHEKDEFVKEDILGSPNRHNDLLKGSGSVEWIVRRLHEACDQLTSVYIRLYNQYTSDNQYNITTTDFDLDRSLSWTPMSSPARDSPPRGHLNPDERPNSPGLNSSWKYSSPDHKKDKSSRENRKHHIEEDLRMIELERQMLKRKEDELLQLGIWTNLVILMLESLLGLPTLQFKAVLPAVFPAVTGLITTGTDPKVRQLVCDVVRRVGTIYGIL